MWLNFQFLKLKFLIPTHVCNTFRIVHEVRVTNDVPYHVFLFEANADSIYNHIDIAHTILIIEIWFEELATCPNCLVDFQMLVVKSAMWIITTSSHFKYNVLRFFQLLSSAMKTLAAVILATIHFACHKVKCLFPTYGLYLD